MSGRPVRVPVDPALLDDVLAAAVAAGHVPHVVALVADADGPVYTGSAGPAGLDSLFRIASMTKIFTTVAALQQAERGRLHLDAPVATYLPQFADLRVLDGFDGDTPGLRPPRSLATVRRLMMHTAGLGYWFWDAGLARWHRVTGTPTVASGRAEALTAPLVADPGSRFDYGVATDWLGLVVEAVAGQPLDRYVEEHLTGPLGMASTSFHPDDALRARLVPVHRRREDGGWRVSSFDWSRTPDWWSGGHGLYSTPRDVAVLQRALLRGGEVDGVRILAEPSVQLAFTPPISGLTLPARIATADPRTSADAELGPGLAWGLGLLVSTLDRTGPAGGRTGRAAGSGGWAGIFNTFYWVDRRHGITAAVYTQTLPFLDPGPAVTAAAFETAVYRALDGR